MKKSKGMLTTEAALIMPLVIYIVFIMISTFLFLYTRVYVALSTNHVIAQATAQWYSIGSDFDTSYRGGSIIGQALGIGNSAKDKEKIVEDKIIEKVKKASPIKVDLDVDANVSNNIIGQKLDITVNGTYTLPVGGLFKLMGLSDDGTITDVYNRTANLSNAEDNIRMIDYASKVGEDVLKEIEKALGGK